MHIRLCMHAQLVKHMQINSNYCQWQKEDAMTVMVNIQFLTSNQCEMQLSVMTDTMVVWWIESCQLIIIIHSALLATHMMKKYTHISDTLFTILAQYLSDFIFHSQFQLNTYTYQIWYFVHSFGPIPIRFYILFTV